MSDDKVKRYFVIGDIHGMHNDLVTLYDFLKEKAQLDLTKDVLVQLGDRNDRGPDSYLVNEFFKSLQLMYPQNVVVLNGNHEYMLLTAAMGHSDLMWFNGGNATEKSYSKETQIYGKNGFGNSVMKAGHWDWLKNLPFYYETEDYFFSHAPIAKETGSSILPLRMDRERLTWEYGNGAPVDQWIDPNPILKEYGNEGKICVHGHLHGIYRGPDGLPIIPGVRKYGNSILIDTGAGCTKDGYITCLELSTMTAYNSKGEIIKL